MRVIILTLAIFSCFSAKAFGRTEIVSSFTIIDYWVGKIAPDRNRKSLIMSGGELHGYHLNPRDSKALAEARVIIAINPLLEPWLEDWAKANPKKAKILWLAPNAKPQWLHSWINPAEAKRMVIEIHAHLQASLPLDQAAAQASLQSLIHEMEETDKKITDLFAPIPLHHRIILSQHDSLAPFTDHFGLKVAETILISNTAECSEPSAKHYADLLKVIREKKIRLITFDEGQNNEIAQRLAEDTKLPPPIPLSFEYLQLPGKEGDTWPSMMLLNARRLAEGLQK
jgi:zinc/manganese transport system substrate-binding protein